MASEFTSMLLISSKYRRSWTLAKAYGEEEKMQSAAFSVSTVGNWLGWDANLQKGSQQGGEASID
jgi:hypothetical protein